MENEIVRLGIYGGTFDPIHIGHLILAESCREACRLDEVWFVPAADPPHKPDCPITPSHLRRQMVERAIADHPQFRVCDLELQRGGTSFTVDTLRELTKRHPTAELLLLIGADSLFDFATWKEPREILNLATLVAVNRGDQPTQTSESPPAPLPADFFDRVRHVQMPGIDVSATRLRENVRQGKSIRYLTPRPVEDLILAEGLYAEDDDTSAPVEP